jgi:ethanolamine utilization protein EutA
MEDGKMVRTGCLNVGGRLLKFDETGCVSYVSGVLDGLCDLKVGDTVSEQQVEDVAALLVQALEMAAGLREPTALAEPATLPGSRI